MLMCDFFLVFKKNSLLNGIKILWDLKSYGKRGPEGPKFFEILSHSVRYGMYAYEYPLHVFFYR